MKPFHFLLKCVGSTGAGGSNLLIEGTETRVEQVAIIYLGKLAKKGILQIGFLLRGVGYRIFTEAGFILDPAAG
jgi:hypothetical protein